MNYPFSRFESFGAIANEEKRKKLADTIYQNLQTNSTNGIGLSDSDSENFAWAIDKTISHTTLKELCAKDLTLAENITLEVLDFINKTKKQIIKGESQFENEKRLIEIFKSCTKENFEDIWGKLYPSIKSTYLKRDIDLNFYHDEFLKSLSNDKAKKKHHFESIKEHFIEKWDSLLFKRITSYELQLIDEQRELFCQDLYQRIEELKKLQNALEPLISELGRLWDLSKGSWQKINLDILKRYADLLKYDNALKELVDMLGKMRQAERKFEEELFTSIRETQVLKIENASKADLIGVHESNDLDSLLPSETALLADNTTQTVFFKKYAEKKLQTFEYQARSLEYIEEMYQDKRKKETEEIKGPFIICVDTSGSMHGTPETVAKTLCLAILKLAIRDNRSCYLISFSTGIETLNLSEIDKSLDKIIAFLSMSFHGGTDATPAMREALRMTNAENFNKADIVMVSDFVMPAFDAKTAEQIQYAKQNKTKFHSLVIGTDKNKAVLKEFDNNWLYDTNNPNSILTLVKNINTL